MRTFLKTIREPKRDLALRTKIVLSVLIAAAGFFLGLFQKWLDASAFNELPLLFQQLDIINYFGRLAIWVLLATIISVYAATPARASLNTFLFLISMVAGYYLYCRFVLGFLPTYYMLMWVAASVASLFLAYTVWYAKGSGMVAIVISSGILGVLFAQAFLITQGILVTHAAEVVTWLVGCFVLRRKPKEWAIEMGLSLVWAVVYELFIPYWG